MPGRIALMVRGLPSIGIDEAVGRFGKYYTLPKRGVFHSSASFPEGYSSSRGTITFTDKQGGYEGGNGLTKQAMGDLRQLLADFKNFTSENPSIYNAQPTSKSRAKLYSRAVGAKNLPNDWSYQVIDTRRIAEQDLPYTKAIDKAILPDKEAEILVPNQLTAFLNVDGYVIAGSRISGAFRDAMRGDTSKIDNAVNQIKEFKESYQRQRMLKKQAILDQHRRSYEYLLNNPSEMQAIESWARSRGLQISEYNASDIMRQYYPF